MLQYVPAIGSTCLGIVIGYLVRFFIRRFNNYGAGALGSVVTIILGGAVVKFLEADKSVWWFYPIGLFLGFAIYQVIAMRVVSGGRPYYGHDEPGYTQPIQPVQSEPYVPRAGDPRVANIRDDDNKML